MNTAQPTLLSTAAIIAVVAIVLGLVVWQIFRSESQIENGKNSIKKS